jgi:4-hydroxy-2-oxoglutarate aldolase
MIIVAATTPFMANGAVDFGALRHNVARWIEAGVDGVLVLGSTGEAIHLDDAESEEIVAAAREVVPTGKLLMVGPGRPTTAGTIRFTGRAAARGADLALVLTPFYYRHEMTSEALERYYRAVADAAPLPILLYSMPALTGITISAGLAERLSTHARIFGLKDSSGDVAALFERVERCAEHFRVFNGSARSVYPALAAGSAGSILAIASVAPEIAVAAHGAYAAGDLEGARRAAVTLARLSARLAPHGLGGLKAAMTVRGYRGGICRPPLAFDFKAMRDVEAALAEAGLGERS